MNKHIKLLVIFLCLAGCFMILSMFRHTLKLPEKDLSACATSMERDLNRIITDYNKMLGNEELIKSLLEEGILSPYYQEILEKPFIFLIYRNNQLFLWNENIIVPPDFLVSAIDEGSNSIKLQNGYYEISKIAHPDADENITFIRLILLQSYYDIQNDYLQNKINPFFELPAYLRISLNEVENSAPVENLQGKVLCYLTVPQSQLEERPNHLRIIVVLLAFLFFFLSFDAFSRFLSTQLKFRVGLLFMIVSFTMLRLLTLHAEYPLEFYDLALFSPQLYASSTVNKSLGDLIINIILLLWVAVYFYTHADLRRIKLSNTPLKFTVAVIIFLGIFLGSQVLIFLFRSLLMDSKIPFDFNNFLDLNYYSLIGFFGIAMAIVAYLLVTRRLLGFINAQSIPEKYGIYLTLVSFVIYLAFLFVYHFHSSQFLSAFTILGLILIIQRVMTRGYDFSSPSNVLTILIVLALFSSLHLYHYNDIKDKENRKILARKLSIERDLITEYLFLDIQERILNDLFIRNYFRKPFISTQEIVDRIATKYFSGFFSKYEANVYTLNQEGKVIRSNHDQYLDLLNSELLESAQQTLSDFLFYIPKPGGSYAYISNLPIIYRGKLIGSVVLELTPKTYTQTNLYPELLLEEKIKPPENIDKYSYALYSNDLLIKKGGTYPYKYDYSFSDSLKFDYLQVEEDDLTHLIYNAGNGKKVVVTSLKDTLIKPVSLFSYLFCIYLIFSFTGLAIVLLVNMFRNRSILSSVLNFSFKDKIQFSMIAVIVFSFFMIGYVTIAHFTTEYNSYHEERLMRKKKAILTAIEYIIKDDVSIITEEQQRDPYKKSPIDLASLSDIHAMDINIYGLYGKLVNTSQPEIFEKGLLSEMIDPEAYKGLLVKNKTQYVQNETIGTLQYLSIYAAIRNNEGTLVGYLNLPYFAKERELNTEISNLLVALINVYVLLLVIGGFLAYLLSDSITKSLTAISEKLKFVQLGKKNEPIEWHGKDEIGILVAEYNKMIAELERSAELLAKSERESAWREMAKQIAHEIKNPLTPMKLSIQHLQRAMAEDDPRAKELAKKVSVTLIEQIENLAHIATEFSSFAKMPKVQNELVNISDLLQTVVNLFSEEKDINIHYQKPPKEHTVFADKNQLISAFNNLIKNATQAIPFGKDGEIDIEQFSINGSVRTTIKDNGIGISNDQENKVFVPNFTTKSGGTGLGLALTKQIVENARGKIWFESEENVGTTFYVELPEYKPNQN